MSIWSDPRDYIDVESQLCQIGRNRDCGELADGQCEECGKLICRFPSCSVELPDGFCLCVDCHEAIETAVNKQRQGDPIAA
jgi:hypothetical protein